LEGGADVNANQINMWLSTLTNIGVLIGIVLLVVELNQNAELMRVEMHTMRAEAKAERQMGLANSGEIVRIFQQATAAGFPENPESLNALTAEDRFRMIIFVSGLKEAISNWHYQCQEGMLDAELCRSSYPAQVKNLVWTLHGMNVGLSDMRESFIADVRKIAQEEGLPVPNEDGSW
jgi:hypothetical protein